MYEKTQNKSDYVDEILKDALVGFNLKNKKTDDIIDYRTSYSPQDWNILKSSQYFNIIKDDNGERLVMR